jgi:MarR family transcriptional regulator, organic hydroperoxide resistance regulator
MLDGDVEGLYERRRVNFRPRFYPVARHLIEHRSASISSLAAATGVSQPAATQTIKEMANAGLVQTELGSDRRYRVVMLSEEGERMARALGPIWSAIDAAAQALDEELQFPLSVLLDEATTALCKTSFANRIESQLQGD